MTDCRQVKRDIRAGSISKWKDHLNTCDDCKLFADNLDLMQSESALAQEPNAQTSATDLNRLFQEIEQETHHPSIRFRMASQPALYRYLTAIGVVLIIVIYVLIFKRRIDWYIYPTIRFTTELLAMASVLTLHLWLTIRPLHHPPLRIWKRVGLVVTTAIIVVMPMILPLAHHDHPESLKGVGDDLIHRAISCFAWGTAIGATLVTAGRFLIRGGKKSPLLNVPLLFAGGMLALFSLHLHCPIVQPLHIALGHSSIMVGVWGLALFNRRPTARH